MSLEFGTSAQSTLGIEWEIALVDQASGQLVARADELLERVAPRIDADAPYEVVEEFLANTIEIVTGVNSTVSAGIDQLAEAGRVVLVEAEKLGLGLYSQGSHPVAEPMDQPVTGEDRYQRMLDRTQWWGQQMVIFGVHTHVGLDHRAKAMPAANHLINHYAAFLALSSSSPFWRGFNTGYASQRAQIFQQLPTSGLPFQFARWEEFSRTIDEMVQVGVIADVTEARWDIRPVPRFGTIEVRVCDGLTSLREIAAVTALTQCLVHEVAGGSSPKFSPEILQPWFVQENKWQASRYGLEADVIIDTAGTMRPLREFLDETLNRLEPIAQQLGCATELGWAADILREGTDAHRQLAVAGNPAVGEKVSEDVLREVVTDATRRLADSIRQW